MPANLAQPCLPVPTVTSDSWDEFARSYMALALQYGDCAARQRAMVRSWPSQR
ncbi:hypothetical protein [Achromobacter spanius]|uniref:hypothetical protein n=1 Tax=Achromobacter spanius TaxID=217203 RepID=UPI003D65B91E